MKVEDAKDQSILEQEAGKNQQCPYSDKNEIWKMVWRKSNVTKVKRRKDENLTVSCLGGSSTPSVGT